ncbi:MAG: histidine triad nucleotide-binding protein [Candidatus Aminicenantes bacterium]|nr:histidine triad nucleotide-binding protein [Candidatus Aminicenantes bacterium]
MSESMGGCVFCGFVSKLLPARIILEDDEVLAFDDIRPQAPVHALLIPKRHLASLNDADEGAQALLGRLLLKAREVARLKGIEHSGYRIVINAGPDSGQDVFHLHVHILGGRRMSWPPG